MYFHIKLLIKSANFIFPVLALTVYLGDFPSLFHCLWLTCFLLKSQEIFSTYLTVAAFPKHKSSRLFLNISFLYLPHL